MRGNSQFDLRERLRVLSRGARMLGIFVASATVSALVFTYMFSEYYTASITILYRPNAVAQFEGNGQQSKTLGFPVPAVYPFEAMGLTIRQVCTSERILRPVVIDLGLDQPDSTERTGLAALYHDAKEAVRSTFSKAWQVLKYGRVIEEDKINQAILELSKNTKVDTRQKNHMAVLTVSDKDPERAARIANRIGEELVRFLREQSSRSAHEQGLEVDQRLVAKKATIDEVRDRIAKLKSTNDFIDLPTEIGLRLKTAEQFQEKLIANKADLVAARARLASLVEQERSLPSLVKSTETTAEDPVYKFLRESQASLKVEQEGQAVRLAKDHPDLRSTQARLETVEGLLGSLKSTHLSQVGMEGSKVQQMAQGDELRARSTVAGLEAEQAAIEQSLAKARSRIPTPAIEAAFNDLNMKLTALESDYKRLSNLREELHVTELTSQAEATMLHPAAQPDAPTRPIKIYHVLLSALLAVLLGVLLVYMIDYVRFLLAKPVVS